MAPAADHFDVDVLVAVLSRPTTFGTAGLRGWERGRLPNGQVRAMARDGAKIYEVRADRVAVLVQFEMGRAHTVVGAAAAARRLIDAIFGEGSEPAAAAAIELLYAVGTEPGTRQFARTVDGRTLTAGRVRHGGEQVRFAIHPR